MKTSNFKPSGDVRELCARQEKLKARTQVNSYNCFGVDHILRVFLEVFCESS